MLPFIFDLKNVYVPLFLIFSLFACLFYGKKVCVLILFEDAVEQFPVLGEMANCRQATQ